MGRINNSRLKVGAHPLLIPNAMWRSQSQGARSNGMEDGTKDPVIPSIIGHISDRESAPEIRCGPRSITSVNISDGNKHSHPACKNAVIKNILDGRQLINEIRYIRYPCTGVLHLERGRQPGKGMATLAVISSGYH